MIQIIGRCTRDCEGKPTAQFVNLIAMPEAEQADVKVAVNDFLKAITASLLMEQVMAPSWNFRTSMEDEEEGDTSGSSARTLHSQKFEDMVHQLLKAVQFHVTVTDDHGHEHHPKEWFVVPLSVVDAIVGRIVDGSITAYSYNAELQCLEQHQGF